MTSRIVIQDFCVYSFLARIWFCARGLIGGVSDGLILLS